MRSRPNSKIGFVEVVRMSLEEIPTIFRFESGSAVGQNCELCCIATTIYRCRILRIFTDTYLFRRSYSRSIIYGIRFSNRQSSFPLIWLWRFIIIMAESMNVHFLCDFFSFVSLSQKYKRTLLQMAILLQISNFPVETYFTHHRPLH